LNFDLVFDIGGEKRLHLNISNFLEDQSNNCILNFPIILRNSTYGQDYDDLIYLGHHYFLQNKTAGLNYAFDHGLLQFENVKVTNVPTPPVSPKGLPGWAIALIVISGVFVLGGIGTGVHLLKKKRAYKNNELNDKLQAPSTRND
jgi:hypothetical protein